ncbi:MAG TPA: 16S rRNA (adenine(1518)-N(6)/adenine(1519)-N(6))-dimethyltransferase RsmA [Gemmatimonadaceae bacterium]|nr:16S rRNA (adenine(1518)-N(6)/adenine(1519)-N(6))-dimethyltransferase RsmA [Gemmatimonadaceae bacterium]
MTHRPRKRLGQHFLNDRRILARIVETLDPQPNETVVEIGPGKGALTSLLAPRSSRLIAIELDRDLAGVLRAEFAGLRHVEIVEADALDVDLATLSGGEPWSVIGNVPYYITTPILFHALAFPRPRTLVLLVQREVGERLAASPGSSDYGALSVTAQAVAQVTRHGRVPAGAFQPPPSVDSVIVRLTPLQQPLILPAEEAEFKSLVQAAFSFRRKQMLRVVRSIFDLNAPDAASLLLSCGIEQTARPEVLAPQAYVDLLRAARSAGLQRNDPNDRRELQSGSDSRERS